MALQVLKWLFTVWMIDVKCLILYQHCPDLKRATHCKVDTRKISCGVCENAMVQAVGLF
jgi:hypothetical protein